MINWMQKHRKSLIPTIWISVIAFVGAGVVAWGTLDYNKDRATSVAKVGDTAISIQDFSQKRQTLFNYFKMISDGNFNEEEANKMNLNGIVLNELIRETMLLNFAKDLGIHASDEDVAKYIISLKEFQKDGVFDRDLYNQAVRYSGLKHSEFDKSLKKIVILDKLNYALDIPPTKDDIDMMLSAYFMQDRLSIQTISLNISDINPDEEGLKKFWEEHKNLYKTKKTYKLLADYYEPILEDVSEKELEEYYNSHRSSYIDNDDKLLKFDEVLDRVKNDYLLEEKGKKEANKIYLNVKDGKKELTQKISVSEDNQTFPLQMLADKNANQVLKPFIYNDKYIIVKIDNIVQPETMTYEEARDFAILDYKKLLLREKLEKDSKTILQNNFEGQDIGFVNRDTQMNVANLDSVEFRNFINEVFDSENQEGFVILENKAVIYKILEQKLGNNEKKDEYNSILAENIENLKANEFKKELLEQLQKRYKIEKYYKGDEIE